MEIRVHHNVNVLQELDFTAVQRFLSLRHLYILGSGGDKILLFLSTNSLQIKELQITHLHISFRSQPVGDFKRFLSLLPNLQVLNIANGPEFTCYEPLEFVFSALANKPLNALSLRQIQSLCSLFICAFLELNKLVFTTEPLNKLFRLLTKWYTIY